MAITSLHDWLRERGVPEHELSSYDHAARVLTNDQGGPILPWQVDQGVERAQANGATTPQLVNLKRLGLRLVEYYEEQRPLPSAAAPPAPTPAPVPDLHAPPATEWRKFKGTRRCRCGPTRVRPQITRDRRGIGLWGGVATGLTIAGVFLVGILGAGALACGVLAVGSFANALGITYECASCGKSVRPNADERATLWKERAGSLLVAVLLAAAAASLGILWLTVAAASTADDPDAYELQRDVEEVIEYQQE